MKTIQLKLDGTIGTATGRVPAEFSIADFSC